MPHDSENESVNVTNNDNELTHVELIEQMLENEREIIRLGRRNVALQKLSERSYKRDVKEARKHKKNKNSDQKKDPSGFNKPSDVPEEFYEQPWGCDPEKQLPRTILTKMVYEYIAKHNLKDTEDKRKIITSGEHGKIIRKLFHLKKGEELEFRNFQTYMARLYKRDELPDYASEDEEETPKAKTKKGKGKKNGKSAPNSA